MTFRKEDGGVEGEEEGEDRGGFNEKDRQQCAADFTSQITRNKVAGNMLKCHFV